MRYVLASLAVLLLAPAAPTLAHGGGLNHCGCHVKHATGECHCHRNYGACDCDCRPSTCRAAVDEPESEEAQLGRFVAAQVQARRSSRGMGFHARGHTLIAASSAVAGEPACPGIVAKKLSVDGRNDEWTPTGIKVKAGDLVIVTAEGKVTVGAWTGEVGPNGAPDGNGRLAIKVGSGTVVPVGERWFARLEQETGPLKVRVQDTKYADNGGAYSVTIVVIPASAIPAPVEVAAAE